MPNAIKVDFSMNTLNDIGLEHNRQITKGFEDLKDLLNRLLPENREASIVATKLEEACFYAKKCSARVPGRSLEAPEVK